MLSFFSEGAALPIIVGIQENIFFGNLAASTLSAEDSFWIGNISIKYID